LRGRESECALLDGMIAAVREGESSMLVVWGEAGVGKTALLNYAVESASEIRVLRAVGIESEMELAFASLHQLCAPLLDHLVELPAPQREALEIAHISQNLLQSFRSPAELTEFVAVVIACETNPRSTPNCVPSSGSTMINAIRIVMP